MDFAIRPGIIASQVSARVKITITSIAIITSHSNTPVVERNLIMNVVKVIITTETALENSEVNTCAIILMSVTQA